MSIFGNVSVNSVTMSQQDVPTRKGQLTWF